MAPWESGVYDEELQTFVNGDAPCASAITLSPVLVFHSVIFAPSGSFKYWSRMIKPRFLYLCARSVLFVRSHWHIAITKVSCNYSTVTEEIPAK